MDILERIHEKVFSVEEAYKVIDRIIQDTSDGKYVEMEKDGRIDMAAIFGMDKYEYTAYAQGAGLDDLVRWRYEGWPTHCAETGKPIDYKNFGWMVRDFDDESKLILIE